MGKSLQDILNDRHKIRQKQDHDALMTRLKKNKDSKNLRDSISKFITKENGHKVVVDNVDDCGAYYKVDFHVGISSWGSFISEDFRIIDKDIIRDFIIELCLEDD